MVCPGLYTTAQAVTVGTARRVRRELADQVDGSSGAHAAGPGLAAFPQPPVPRRRLMQKATLLSLAFGAALLVAVTTASAQQTPAPQPPPPSYGMPINLDQAKKVMAGAEAEAKKNNWPVAIVILDSGGQMVMMQRLDNTQWGSVDIAKEKARSAVALRRPTKALQDAIAQGGSNLRLLSTGFSMLEGGIPIIVDGKIIGSVGVSGVTSQQDAQTAQAGIDNLK
jgi:uncharacterized protein GlcG (DUF336 family)